MIGRIERVPLREVWKKEAKDFTTWLFDNLEVIGEELDMDLTPDKKEKRVGSFSADITAEDASGQKVIPSPKNNDLFFGCFARYFHVWLRSIHTNLSCTII